MSGIRGKFEVKGAREVYDLLKQLPDEFARKEVRKAQNQAAKVVVKEAQNLAPKDSGRLEEHISHSVFYQKKTSKMVARVGLIVRSARARQKRAERLAKKGMGGAIHDAWYGKFVEFGTRFQKPQHFMKRAFIASKEQYTQTFVSILSSRLPRVIDKLKGDR